MVAVLHLDRLVKVSRHFRQDPALDENLTDRRVVAPARAEDLPQLVDFVARVI